MKASGISKPGVEIEADAAEPLSEVVYGHDAAPVVRYIGGGSVGFRCCVMSCNRVWIMSTIHGWAGTT